MKNKKKQVKVEENVPELIEFVGNKIAFTVEKHPDGKCYYTINTLEDIKLTSCDVSRVIKLLNILILQSCSLQ